MAVFILKTNPDIVRQYKEQYEPGRTSIIPVSHDKEIPTNSPGSSSGEPPVSDGSHVE